MLQKCSYIYEADMTPALNTNSVLRSVELGDMLEICRTMIYLVAIHNWLPHIYHNKKYNLQNPLPIPAFLHLSTAGHTQYCCDLLYQCSVHTEYA